LFWSAYWLVTEHSRKMHEAIEYTTGVTMTAALSVTLLVVVSRQPLSDVKSTDWLWFSLLAIVPGSGHLVMNWAHRYVDASISSAISCLSPLVAAVAALIILGQRLTVVQAGGVLLGLVAIAVLVARYREPVDTAIG
jgi:drug/metabolite transporter (DMT)-like permease